MQLSEITFTTATPIDGYGPGFFRVGGQVIEGAALVTETGARGWGGYDDAETLLSLAGEVDVIFVGTGAAITPIPAALRAMLEEAGVGVEIMASDAACRTYNVLLSEGRRIGLALIALDPDAAA